MAQTVAGLRSPYETVGGVFAFARMLDKIRLHASGQLPEAYLPHLGTQSEPTLDGRVCRFLKIDYTALRAETLKGLSDEAALQWSYDNGRQASDEEIEIWNAFISKRGWRDESSSFLREITEKENLPPVHTFFDYMDADEGRPPVYPADPPAPQQPAKPTAIIPGLRSPYETIGGIVHFGRMLDKIRLDREGKLPEDWAKCRGIENGFDQRCCRFLGIDYTALETETLKGGSDDDLLAWTNALGKQPDSREITLWNAFMTKRGWHDAHAQRVQFRLKESGMPAGAALTMFDFIDLDEGRPLRFPR